MIINDQNHKTMRSCARALVRLALVHLMQHVAWQTAEAGETAIISIIVAAVERDAGHVMKRVNSAVTATSAFAGSKQLTNQV